MPYALLPDNGILKVKNRSFGGKKEMEIIQ